MPDETTAAPIGTDKNPRLVRSLSFRTAYANTFRLRIGAQELSVTFGYQNEVPGPTGSPQHIIQDEVEIVFTPLTFKLLAHGLQDAVQNYEKAIGEIVFPAPLVEALKAIAEQQARQMEEASEKKEPSA
jgi:Protein of unknown function (DUF3467)